tara:strand:+ start:2025 stop:2687 length:663 start_codon:yes stop_codon:yes gene_type:complete
MSKKNLLNESQIRQFMKLASLEPLTPGFVTGLTETTRDPDVSPAEEDLEESHGNGGNETNRTSDGTGRRRDRGGNLGEAAPPGEELKFATDDLADDSLEGDEEAAADELEAGEEEFGAEEGAGGVGEQTVAVKDLMVAITSALEDVIGEPVESEIDDVPVEPEAEPEAEVDVADVEELPGGGEDEVEMDAELPLQEDLVEHITKRVAARILKSALARNKK